MAQKVSSLAIDITVTGAPQASAALGNVEKGGKGAADSLAGMAGKGALAGAALAGLAVGARKFLEAAEQYNRIGAKLAVVTSSVAQARDVQEDLYRVAQETGSEFEALAGTYARIALSAKDLGVTQAQMVQVTANVAKSLQVSGASASEAAAGATQLAQALGSGKLAGDELKSILENAPVLARAIASGLGVSVGQLREMGSQGKLLSSDVFGAILKQTGEIDTAFDKIGTSMERSGTRLSNSFNRALGAIDNKIGASRGLSALFDLLAGSIDQGIGRSAGAFLGGGIPGLVASVAQSSGQTSKQKGGVQGQLPTITVTGNRPKPRTTGGGRSTARSGITQKDRIASNPNKSDPASPAAGLSGVAIGSSASELIEQNIAGMIEAMQPALNLAESFGQTLADSLANGITAAVSSGSIGEGFKELGRTLIGGLGAQIRDFGVQALLASQLMQTLKSGLAGLAPGVGIAASLGLIALGSAMVGVAGRGARASFGTTNSGINRGASASSTITERGVLSLPSSLYGGVSTTAGASGQVASAMQPVNVYATIIGPNDPTAQRQMQELIRRGAARGAA